MTNQIFNPIRRLIQEKRLGDALHMLKSMLASNQIYSLTDEVESIENDYELMLNYFSQGFADPQRKTLFESLLRKTMKCVNNGELAFQIKNWPVFGYAKSRGDRMAANREEVRRKLENFMSDLAINQLMGDTAENQEQRIYEEHHDFITAVFDALWTGGQWGNDEAEFYTQLILSPTIHINDALMLTSAVQLSLHNFFDSRKWLAMIEIYRKAGDERLRQRALVGWALAPMPDAKLYPEVADKLKELSFDDITHRQLTGLQMQIYFCLNAENDHEEIQREIMPNLIKNNGFNITRFGITEKEDDPMQDILNPHAEEEAMETMEKNFQKMMDMQKAGSDIYFGGFAQMKRFGFFQTLANWFCPFYIQHPDIKTSADKLKNSRFMQNLFEHGPFCDSDKYSFALAMKSVIDRIPENMREMMDSQEALGPTLSEEEKKTTAYIRRMYLQDLYRFHKLFSDRKAFRNPFESEGNGQHTEELFLRNRIFSGLLLDEDVTALAQFLMKRKRFHAMAELLDVHANPSNPQQSLLKAWAYYHLQDYEQALNLFSSVLERQLDIDSARKGLAKVLMRTGRFDEASIQYQTLLEGNPDNKHYRLNLTVCLIQQEKYDEALKHAFQLGYEHPDDSNVKRVLAWCLLHSDKREQAIKEYETLTAKNDAVKDDFLNEGYCYWVNGRIPKAIAAFRKYVGMCESNKGKELLRNEWMKEADFLDSHGIDEYQRNMLLDLL